VETLSRHGVLTKDAHEHTIRIAPPLVITREEADWAIERFEAALKAKPRTGRDAFATSLHAATA
jgi:acetylornithine/succinyldiaminopimelate/putrescine aminotransferase